MLGHVLSVVALAALFVGWVLLQRASGCEGGGTCSACTCRGRADEST